VRSPQVSVVIPTWNRAREVPAAIDSALAQTRPPFEVVIVDDGSTDETQDVLARYGDRIRVLRQENAGASAARNAGIRASRGEFVAFLDSDDLWSERKLEKQLELLERADVACCIANMIQVGPGDSSYHIYDRVPLKPRFPQGILLNPVELLCSRFIPMIPTLVVARGVFEKVGLFDTSFSVHEDHEFALRLGRIGPWVYTTEPLASVHRQTASSLTARAKDDERLLQDTILRMYEKLLREPEGLSPRAKRLARRELARARRRTAADAGGRSAIRRFCGRIGDAAWRRSPGFPRPEVRPLASSAAAREEEQSGYPER